MTTRRTGLAIAGLATAGLVISLYLLGTRIAGGLPVCGPIQGCETVARSEYSEIAGIPVAALGTLFSAAVLVLGWWWWWAGDRRALLGAYGLGLFGLLFVAYLTYLELFVIHAVCVWCVGYAVTVVAGWLIAAWAVRGRSDAPGDDAL